MAKKESRRVKTLSGFMKWAEQFEPGQYLFRGVSKASYSIEASAARRLPKSDRNNPIKLLKINKEMIRDACLEGHNLKDGQRLFDLELLAELQHYGAATCLIDFTYSAQVALWMACWKRSRWDVNGKVFAVRSNDPIRFKKVTPAWLQENLDYFFKPDKHNRYLSYQWQPKQQNNRIIAQQSVFLFGGAKIEPDSECVILKSSKEAILDSLEKSSGIKEARMFPDFDGFARLRAQDREYIEPNARNYLQFGIEAAQENKPDDAIAYYNEVISLYPVDDLLLAEVHCYRASAYDSKGDYDKATKLNPNFAYAYHNRGLVYVKKHETDLAIKDFSKVIELNPDSPFAYSWRATAYENNGQIDRAIEDHSKVIELIPDDAKPYHYFLRGIAWLRLEDWDKAREDLTVSQNMGLDIIGSFSERYNSIADFEEEFQIELSKDISAMLTMRKSESDSTSIKKLIKTKN